MQQFDLRYEAFSRSTDPATSFAAVDTVTPYLNRLEQIVYDALKASGERGR